MNQQTVQQIQDALKPVADKLGQAAHAVYASYVRDAVITGIQEIVWPTLLVVSLAVVTRWWMRHAHRQVEAQRDVYGEDDWAVAAWAVPILPWLIVLGVFFAYVPSGISHVANPQYHAISNLLYDVKQ